MTTVLIADDQPMQRFGFRMLLESQDDMTVVGEAGNGAEAIDLIARHQPDVALMDIRMPGLDGIEATRRIIRTGSRTRVLIVTTFDLDEYAYDGLRAGASGFLVKDALPEELLSGIRAVAAGDAVVAPSLTRRLLDAYARHLPVTPGDTAPPASSDPRITALTDREDARHPRPRQNGMPGPRAGGHPGLRQPTGDARVGKSGDTGDQPRDTGRPWMRLKSSSPTPSARPCASVTCS